MRRQKYKIYGGTRDIGGGIMKALSRFTKTVMCTILFVLYQLVSSFAIMSEVPETIHPDTFEVHETAPVQVTVPVTRSEIIEPEPEIIPDEEVDDPNRLSDDQKGTYLGTFCITHYCTCSICNGSNAGKTATGYTPVPWNTVAVDPSLIPLGSSLYIEGYGTMNALDTGRHVNKYHIDVLTNSHEEAIQCGVVYKEVYLL